MAGETVSPGEVWAGCTRFLGGHGTLPMRAVLENLASEAGDAEKADHYGMGEVVQGVESEVAELLGKEAALFFPTGTMTQQIALRLWCDRVGRPVVAFHPTCHLEIHEQHAYQVMHGLRAQVTGGAEKLISLEDLDSLGELPGALLLELPQREIGGMLPDWEDLQAQIAWARERGVKVHMDGARLWESGPFYGRPYAEIAAGFDSVYVSFYKGLGALGGAALAGPAGLIAEARVWQRRHGGNLYRLFPYALSARHALRTRLGRFTQYHERAVAIARALASVPGVRVKPDPPQTNMMHLYLSGDRERLKNAALDVARQDRVALFRWLRDSGVPGVSVTELSIGDGALAIADDEVRDYFSRVVAAGTTSEVTP